MHNQDELNGPNARRGTEYRDRQRPESSGPGGLVDARGASPALMAKVLGDPKFAEGLLGGVKAVTMFEGSCRQIVALPSALKAYRLFYTGIAEPTHRPALFHCQTRKDRTGWAAAGGDRQLIAPVLGVQPSFLDAAIDEMEKRYGTIEGYFTNGLGFDEGWIGRFRTTWIESV